MRVVGVMSGTSLDGIDVAIVDISGKKIDCRAFHSVPYPKAVREALLSVSNNITHTATISRLNFLLGALYADAIHETCRRHRLKIGTIELCGLHGQTIFHEGQAVEYLGMRVASTLQIGEAPSARASARFPIFGNETSRRGGEARRWFRTSTIFFSGTPESGG